MGVNWLGALGGMFQGVAEVSNSTLQRQRELEQRRLMEEMQARKEQAQLVRDSALAEFKEKLEDKKIEAREKQLSMQFDAADKRNQDSIAQRDRADENRMKALMAKIEASSSKPLKDSTFAEKLAFVKDPENGMTDEERKEAMMALVGADKKKGGLTDSQEQRLEMALAKLDDEGGPTDENIHQYNTIRGKLGMPPMKKVEAEKGKDGILGFGKKAPTYKYVEDWSAQENKTKQQQNSASSGILVDEKTSGKDVKLEGNTGKKSDPASDFIAEALKNNKPKPAPDKGEVNQQEEPGKQPWQLNPLEVVGKAAGGALESAVSLGRNTAALAKMSIDELKQLDAELTKSMPALREKADAATLEALKNVREFLQQAYGESMDSKAQRIRSLTR